MAGPPQLNVGAAIETVDLTEDSDESGDAYPEYSWPVLHSYRQLMRPDLTHTRSPSSSAGSSASPSTSSGTAPAPKPILNHAKLDADLSESPPPPLSGSDVMRIANRAAINRLDLMLSDLLNDPFRMFRYEPLANHNQRADSCQPEQSDLWNTVTCASCDTAINVGASATVALIIVSRVVTLVTSHPRIAPAVTNLAMPTRIVATREGKNSVGPAALLDTTDPTVIEAGNGKGKQKASNKELVSVPPNIFTAVSSATQTAFIEEPQSNVPDLGRSEDDISHDRVEMEPETVFSRARLDPLPEGDDEELSGKLVTPQRSKKRSSLAMSSHSVSSNLSSSNWPTLSTPGPLRMSSVSSRVRSLPGSAPSSTLDEESSPEDAFSPTQSETDREILSNSRTWKPHLPRIEKLYDNPDSTTSPQASKKRKLLPQNVITSSERGITLPNGTHIPWTTLCLFVLLNIPNHTGELVRARDEMRGSLRSTFPECTWQGGQANVLVFLAGAMLGCRFVRYGKADEVKKKEMGKGKGKGKAGAMVYRIKGDRVEEARRLVERLEMSIRELE
ncbi:hypothetical protein E4T42_04758 [Aureobasidium subglaciale]|nr:hypothetical protein E4T42_04758 [Aureobasidium subglaciale]